MTDPSKETLRYEAIRHRDRISVFANEDPEAVCGLFFEAIQPRQDQVIALYWPKDKEFDVRFLLERLLRDGYACALPVVRKGERVLGFARWKDDDPLEDAPFGLKQPVVDGSVVWAEPDIVVVPFLAFDRKGYRLGYGGGYYDATLRTLRREKPIIAIGVGYAQQAVLFNLPVESHDEKLDWVITPLQAHCFCNSK